MDKQKSINQEALEYHSMEKPGKIEVIYTKPFNSQKDLSLAYTPGVAEVCMQIKKTHRMYTSTLQNQTS
jgi:malate dehydrogenase (oxaloacetate-decarboxylating)(NADP+)